MGAGEHKHCAKKNIGSLRFAVIVTSDSRTRETDTSGKAAVEILENAGHKNVKYALLPNDADLIRRAVRACIEDDNVDIIITSGGTGCGKKDVTIEAVSGLYEKHLPGFGEFFRFLSKDEIGTAAFMSRASLGIAKGKPIVSVPGSTNAIRLALTKLILLELDHIVWETRR